MWALITLTLKWYIGVPYDAIAGEFMHDYLITKLLNSHEVVLFYSLIN